MPNPFKAIGRGLKRAGRAIAGRPRTEHASPRQDTASGMANPPETTTRREEVQRTPEPIAARSMGREWSSGALGSHEAVSSERPQVRTKITSTRLAEPPALESKDLTSRDATPARDVTSVRPRLSLSAKARHDRMRSELAARSQTRPASRFSRNLIAHRRNRS
jgi:hypothetical protein